MGLAGFIVPAATRGSSASAPGSLFSEHALLGGRLGTRTEVLCAAVSSTPCSVVADRDPVEAAVDRPVGGVVALADALGGEHHLVAVQAAVRTMVVLLVPDDPRHGVVGAGERDVRLDRRRAWGRRSATDRRLAAAQSPTCCKQKPPMAGI